MPKAELLAAEVRANIIKFVRKQLRQNNINSMN